MANSSTSNGSKGSPEASPAPVKEEMVAAPTNGTAPAMQTLKHNPGVGSDWTAEEQAILDDGLSKYANEASLKKYIKIAALLLAKTVRDVALRCNWMKREYGTRRKAEEAKKNNHKKERALDSSIRAPTTTVTRPPLPMYTLPPLPIDNDDGISSQVVGGVIGQLLDHNAQLVNQIRTNLAAYKIQENTDLLVRFRENMFTIINSMEMPGIMSQMPPLPVKINSELADTLLPKPT